MSETNGRMRLVTGADDCSEDTQPQVPRVPSTVWWFAVVILLQLASLLSINYDRQKVRAELDENATLIRQLQERQVIRDLHNIRKGTP